MRHILPCAVLAVLLMVRAGAAPAQPAWNFVALGDVPYSLTDVPAFEDLIEAINGLRPAFSVHVGDTKASTMPCGEAWSRRVLGWFSRFQSPLVYTPGDNEWTDCHRAIPPSDPARELARLREIFFATPQSLGARPMPLQRQNAAYPENQSWQRDGIRFLTLHMVGSYNNRRRDEPEYRARNAANLEWLKQGFARARAAGDRAVAVFFQADIWYVVDHGRGSSEGMEDASALLEAETRAFGRPVLAVQGDSHICIAEWAPPGFQAGRAPIPNLLRVQVPGDNLIDAVVIEVGPDATRPFAARPLLSAARSCAPPQRKP